MSSIFDLVKETHIYKIAMEALPAEEKPRVEMAAMLLASRFDSLVSQLEAVSKDPDKSAEMRKELLKVSSPVSRAASKE